MNSACRWDGTNGLSVFPYYKTDSLRKLLISLPAAGKSKKKKKKKGKQQEEAEPEEAGLGDREKPAADTETKPVDGREEDGEAVRKRGRRV